MGKMLIRIREYSGRLLLCLLLAGLLAAGWICAGVCEGDVRVLNASGNLNIPLSVDPSRKSDGFSTVLYDIRNGLPTSEANAIAQTDEGFIWIGSYAGLIRYDGNTFERFDSSTGIANVRSLYVDSQNRLWIGTNDSGVFCLSKGEFRKWDQEKGLAPGNIRAFVEDEAGVLYIAGACGIAMMDTEQQVTMMKDERIDGQIVQDIRLGPDGLTYGLTQSGDLFTLKDGKLVTFLSNEECRVKGASAVFPDPLNPGVVYVGTEGSMVYYGSLENNFVSIGVKSIAPLTYVERFEYINGKLWICALNGTGNLDAEGFSRVKNLPMDNSIEHVMTDLDGNLWFTSNRQGIMKIVPNLFTSLFERYDLPETVVNGTCLYKGQLFIGTDQGLIVLDNGKPADHVLITEAVTASGEKLRVSDLISYLDGVRIRSIIRDSKGRLWISTWKKHGLIRYEKGKMLVFTPEDGLFSNLVRTVYECENGSFLVACTGGVNVIQDDVITAGYGAETGFANDTILTVAEGFNREVIMGTDGDGIYIVTPEGTKHIGKAEGLNSEVIMRIKRSRTQGVFWIVTGNSLAYMTPDYQVTTVRHFPFPNNYDLYENSKGDIWVLASSGIYVVSAEELLANEEIEPVFYGIYSGLPGITTAHSYNELTDDGTLYISCSTDVVSVNIENPRDYVSDLKVTVPFINADDARIYPDSEGKFHISRFVRKLTIYPYVFNYAMIDPLVSYRLENFDTEYVTLERSDLTPVDYTNLLNGTYAFTMTVKDPVGHTDKTVSFIIEKGGDMPAGTVVSVILDSMALLFLIGIMTYTSLYRKRGLLHDRLYTVMLLINMAICIGDGLAYLVEGSVVQLASPVMTAGNMICFGGVNAISFMYLLYVEYCNDRNLERLRKIVLPYSIPFLLIIVLLLFNLQTGWLFSVNDKGMYVSGPWSIIVCLPVAFYFLMVSIRGHRMGARMIILVLVLLATRVLWDLWEVEVSSTAFVFTLLLMCLHIHAMNRLLCEVKA